MSNIDKRALNQAELESALLELKRISEQPAVSAHYARVLRQHIANMGHRIAELDKRLIEYAGIATREARRAAEPEARTVNLPAACADEYFIDGVFQALRYERDIERAVIAAGIQVKGE
ncbi:hypothetical protein CUR65_12370 [Salmonella enterica subsp. enterica serovar Legon]|uniref:hypothetical protein n=1 Tax=Salmonella enterica TaxID=28901 RepID=UPI000D3E3C37|nr:hypothetical protein [Salmonella enterica]EIT9255099.1 hypothetical protein [Salmonella enterica subsp. enterica serovar Stanleyville]EDS6807478.1 hypothetical protein [Salmonella enterica subsp. enterica serovar Legon]PVB80442.1 hypothetical protein CUR58_03525 [Salmonella enterica subsp. enterica serovar Legon]PVB87739.1 hypothetical protein CUR65_12370 [Salmonella enterica subsp. enterica serovar Legon]PVB96175.1 hypothetical protein CUR66_03535 [Salmonella enterica subsp. enterica serov